MDKGKGKLIKEHAKFSNAQASINVSIQRAHEIVKKILGLFYKKVDYMTVVHFELMRKEKKLKALADLNEKILTWALTNLTFEALQLIEFIGLELHESVLREIIKKKRENFDPQSW